MTKPRTISGLISHIMREDPDCDIRLHTVGSQRRLLVLLVSVDAKISLKEDIELELVNCERITIPTISGQEVRYMLDWDVSRVGYDKKEMVRPFTFDNRSEARRVRRAVNRQEEDAARMIGGRRHIGSGAIPGLKSDASSDKWQIEAKRTEARSFGLSWELLSKITTEAMTVDKIPMVYVTFAAIPPNVRMEDTWVIIPKSEFCGQ